MVRVGPGRPGPPRVSAFRPVHVTVQPRPCRRPSPISIQSSRVTGPGRLSQSSTATCKLRPSESELRPPRMHYSRSTAGTRDVHCMCVMIVSDPPARCPRGVAMTRRSCISGGSARSASSKSWPARVACRCARRRLGAVTTSTMCNCIPPPSVKLALRARSGQAAQGPVLRRPAPPRPRVVREVASSGRCVLHSVSLGRGCARCAADCPV
jgi:hypothetical protein